MITPLMDLQTHPELVQDLDGEMLFSKPNKEFPLHMTCCLKHPEELYIYLYTNLYEYDSWKTSWRMLSSLIMHYQLLCRTPYS